MIHLIYGNDRNRVLARSKEIVDKAIKFSADGFEVAKFEELIGGRSLFAEKFVVLCDGLLENAEAAAFIFKKAGEISESGSLFVFREGALNKRELEIFKKVGAKVEEFSTGEDKKKGYAGSNFNIFSFTDALGAHDKKLAWVLYQKALRAGFPAEEIFWKAVWLYRNIILVSSINTSQKDIAEKLKMSPFALNNSWKFLKNYTEETLLQNYKKLVDMYHQFRRGLVEMDLALEQFILGL